MSALECEVKDGKVERLALRPQEMARTLGVGRTTAYQMLRSGEIRSIRVGNAIIVPVREIESWLERQRAKTQAQPQSAAGGS